MCTHQYRRQRRLYKQKNYRRCGDDGTVDLNRTIAAALGDPLVQLLISHTVFCRLVEKMLTMPRQTQAVSHRAMRRPARSK